MFFFASKLFLQNTVINIRIVNKKTIVVQWYSTESGTDDTPLSLIPFSFFFFN